MPVYLFVCQACGAETRKLASANNRETPVCKCGGQTVRANQGASSRVMERIDHGTSSRPVERLQDAAELRRERAKNGPG